MKFLDILFPRKNKTLIHENEENIDPLWSSIKTEESKELDKNVNYEDVVVYFENEEIINVVPDVSDYYSATKYNINGKIYDITVANSVKSIPIPKQKQKQSSSLGTPVYQLYYLLGIHAVEERKNGNMELAYALIRKRTELMPYSYLDLQRHDYLREYYWLLDDDRIEDAEKLFQALLPILPEAYSEKEAIKEQQHLNYALLKRHFPKEMPKSFSAYMRNYNAKNDKFEKYIKFADSINIKL